MTPTLEAIEKAAREAMGFLHEGSNLVASESLVLHDGEPLVCCYGGRDRYDLVRFIATCPPPVVLALVERVERAERALLAIRDYPYVKGAAREIRGFAHDAIAGPLGYEDGREPEPHLRATLTTPERA